MANYNNNNYNNGNNRNNNGNYKKRSGCAMKMSKPKDLKVEPFPVIYGWNYSKTYGLVKFVASPSKGGKTKSGKTRKTSFSNARTKNGEVWVMTIQRKFQNDQVFTAFYYPDERKLRCPALQMTASLDKNSWTGSNVRKNG